MNDNEQTRSGTDAFEGFAELPGVRLWYWDTGGSGETLILCHPTSQSCRVWEYQKSAFADAGYRVIAYSRRRHYRSESGDPAFPDTADGDLKNLVDHLGIERAHLLGAAGGGGVAAAFAIGNPDRVRSLTLAGSVVSPDEQEWRDMNVRLEIDRARQCASTEFMELGPSYRAANPEGTERFAELESIALTEGWTRQKITAVVNWQTIETMTAPTLFITGEADLFAPPPLARLVAGHFPSGRVETIREAGHSPYWETPEQFNTAVLAFLRSA